MLRCLVAPGGVVFCHHFRDGVQDHPTIRHPSSPDDILGRGELRGLFCGGVGEERGGVADWHVLLDDEESTLPDGRPMVSFAAQRPWK